MAGDIEDLFRDAVQLPEAKRAELAGLLLDTLSEPEADVEVAWAAEVERRIRQIESGEVTTVGWEEVRARLFARLNAAG